jgi:hypothetical protein
MSDFEIIMIILTVIIIVVTLIIAMFNITKK